jgi:hypothetical protein
LPGNRVHSRRDRDHSSPSITFVAIQRMKCLK